MDQVLCSEVVLSVCLYRLSSTAACIFGVLLENESVVLKLQKGTKGDSNLICDLVQTLTEDEPDVVMNAAGAIASLVWLHNDKCMLHCTFI